jgi:hypothetical protein
MKMTEEEAIESVDVPYYEPSEPEVVSSAEEEPDDEGTVGSIQWVESTLGVC